MGVATRRATATFNILNHINDKRIEYLFYSLWPYIHEHLVSDQDESSSSMYITVFCSGVKPQFVHSMSEQISKNCVVTFSLCPGRSPGLRLWQPTKSEEGGAVKRHTTVLPGDQAL